jgi:hypothetical protein
MPGFTLIDTFPAFLEFWAEACRQPIEEQIEGWAATYMAQWPELYEKQVQDYHNEGLDWRQTARERIFPCLAERETEMQAAHENLLKRCEPIYRAAQMKFGYADPLVAVIYVGIGVGAGWGTTYQDTPALLFGLENIAEEGWSAPDAIEGLVAHELGHLVHFHWRARAGKALGSGPWWQLYEEGFAERCGHVLLGEERWHMASGKGYQGWPEWCRENQGWLAAEFLRRVRCGEDIRPFFGSWYNLRGQKQTGYFLGHALVKKLEEHLALQEIALLEDYESQMVQLATEIARESK